MAYTFQELPVMDQNFSFDSYITSNYPETTDCTYLDTQIKNLLKDGAEIKYRVANTKIPLFGKEPDRSIYLKQKMAVNVFNDLLVKKSTAKVNCAVTAPVSGSTLKETTATTTEDTIITDPITGVKTVVPGTAKKKNNNLLYIIIGSSIILTGVGYWYYQRKK